MRDYENLWMQRLELIVEEFSIACGMFVLVRKSLDLRRL